MVSGGNGVVATLPSHDEIWGWLEAVSDPEIPVISVVDLGIVRAVRWEDSGAGHVLVVTVTPTYSGCPATSVIAVDIADELHRRGIGAVRLETRLSPPWSTEWISSAGRRRLQEYGIATPHRVAGEGTPVRFMKREARRIACPRCGSEDTREVSRFGSTPCKAIYSCRACGEPFDYFKSL